MARTELTDNDEGKRVMTSDGDEIGMISEVRGGRAYVDPDPGMFDTIKAKLNWGEADEETYPIDADDVADVTGDEVRLRRL